MMLLIFIQLKLLLIFMDDFLFFEVDPIAWTG